MINGGSYYPLYAGKLVQVVNESFNPYDAPVTLDTVNVITPEAARSYQKPAEPEPAEEPTELENPGETGEEPPDEEVPEDKNPDDTEPENPDVPPEENPEEGPDNWMSPDELFEDITQTDETP